MTKSTFIATAPDLAINIQGQPVKATLKRFSTGSVGYYLNGKITLPDGTRLQVSGNAVATGSKEWAD